MNLPRYRWQLLRAGPLKLDGGSMFGIVPRALWGRTVRADEQGRIELAHNCLLLEPADASPGDSSPRHVIIEVGSGDKFDEKNRQIFGLTDRCISDAIAEAGISCDDVDHVIVSHLHFDHAGGLTRCAMVGEEPDWIAGDGADSAAGVKLTFPKATIHVQRREWEDAIINRSTMTRTYLPDHLEPIRDRLRLLDSPPPFVPGYLPDRNENPATPVSARESQVLPGIYAFRVPGHTWGQQAIRFTDDSDRVVVFTPDVLPTVHHVGAAYNMAYDVEPFISTVTRRWFLDEAAKNDWLLVLDHEPGNPCQRVRPDGKGWFRLIAEERNEQPAAQAMDSSGGTT